MCFLEKRSAGKKSTPGGLPGLLGQGRRIDLSSVPSASFRAQLLEERARTRHTCRRRCPLSSLQKV
eukprot:6364358-Pyramimonas_sp.AAC.1